MALDIRLVWKLLAAASILGACKRMTSSPMRDLTKIESKSMLFGRGLTAGTTGIFDLAESTMNEILDVD